MKTHHSALLYGLSGAGKSAFINQMIRELLKTMPGKKARLVTAEHYNEYKNSIDEGLLEVWRINNRPHPFEVARAAARGAWPQDPLDPTSPLVEPTKETFETFVIRIFEGIGTIIGYVASNHIEGGLLQRAGTGDIIGPVQEHVQFMDGDEGVGGLCWTHYRIGQMEAFGLVQTSQKYPGFVIWSSHEDDGKDRGQPFVGPQVFGNKATGEIGKEFDDLFHLGTVPVDVQDGEGNIRRLVERRLYLKEHFMPGGHVPYKAKNSAGLLKQKDIVDYIALSKNGLLVEDAAFRLLSKYLGILPSVGA